MKTAVSFYSFDQDVNIREACEQVKEAGYDGVELVISENGELNMNSTDRDMADIRSMVNDMGLEVCSVGAWNLWEYNLAGEDPKVVSYAKDIVKKQIDAAAAFGADTILLVPGWVGTPFSPGIVSYDHAYANSQEAIKELSRYAEAAKVNIGIENVWNKFLLSPLELRRFLDEINSPYVGAYFDVGNIIYIGYPEQWIRILGSKYIKKIHFSDSRFDQAGLGMFVDLLAGDVDFTEVMRAIREIQYDDWITVEFLPNYKEFKYQSIINARLSLDTILNIR